jgi:hypothetical protein
LAKGAATVKIVTDNDKLDLEWLLTWHGRRGENRGVSIASTNPIAPSDLVRLSPSGPGKHGASHLASPEKCERLYVLRFVKKIIPRWNADHLTLCTLIHSRLAYHYAAQLEGEKPGWFSIPLDQALSHDAGGRPDLIEQSRMVFEEWKLLPHEPWKILAVEHEFTATVAELDPQPVPEPGIDEVVLSAKLDLLIEDLEGGIWIVDHKTKVVQWSTDELADWDDNEFSLSWQLHLYKRIVKQTLPHIRGAVIHRLTRDVPVKRDMNIVDLPAEMYAEVPALVRRLVRKARGIRQGMAEGRKPEPNGLATGACGGKFPCDYAPLCKAGRELRDIILDQDYRMA